MNTAFAADAAFLEEESKLVLAAQADPRRFEPLYTRYYERIVQFIYHRVGEKELSFDLTSEVFYKALGNLRKYKSTGVPFSAWLYRIAGNEINQWFRKNSRQRILSIDNDGLKELRGSLEEQITAVQDERLFGALQDISEEERELINMRFFEKRPFREISDILQLGESACKMKLYRVLEKLKTMLTGIND